MIASLAGGEAAGNFLLGKTDRMAQFFEGMEAPFGTASKVFWSGGGNPAVRVAVEEFATKNGMTTLEMTRAGKYLQELTEGMPQLLQGLFEQLH